MYRERDLSVLHRYALDARDIFVFGARMAVVLCIAAAVSANLL
jgi:hypothetical protein